MLSVLRAEDAIDITPLYSLFHRRACILTCAEGIEDQL